MAEQLTPWNLEDIRDNYKGTGFSLAFLLKTDDFPYQTGDFEPLETSIWSTEDYKNFGNWIIEIIDTEQEPEHEAKITRELLTRLRILGLGPSYYQIRSKYETMGKFRTTIGQERGHNPNMYKTWDTNDYVDYAKRLKKQLNKTPTYEDYQQAARDELGPSGTQITEYFGGIRWLNEYLGQPNIYHWEHEDFVDWATKVKKANSGIRLTARLINHLSKNGLGPSASTVNAKIGISKLEFFADNELRRQIEAEQETLKDFHARIDSGNWPEHFKDLDDKSLLMVGSKFLVAKRCLMDNRQDVSTRILVNIANASGHHFIDRLIRADKSLTAGFIERVADDWRVFEYIWPRQENLEFYKVDPADLGYKRRANQERFV